MVVIYRNNIRRNLRSDSINLSKSPSNHRQPLSHYLNPHNLRFSNTLPPRPNHPLAVR